MDTHGLLNLIWIAAGSGLGGMARHGLSGWVARRHGEGFPFGTLAVNASGAFMIGWLASLPWNMFEPPWADATRVFLMYGFLGGYTTISSFSLQTLSLLQEGEVRAALGNAVGSWFLCLGAAVIGSLLPGSG